MKKFKSNIMAMAAILVAAGTLAFTSPATLNSGWYAVAADQQTIGSQIPAPSGDCSTMKTTDLCSVYLDLDPNQPIPQTVSEAEQDDLVSGRAFRED